MACFTAARISVFRQDGLLFRELSKSILKVPNKPVTWQSHCWRMVAIFMDRGWCSTKSLRRNPLLRALRAVAGFYRVNWRRAAAQEYEYVRLRDEAVRKYPAASGGRM